MTSPSGVPRVDRRVDRFRGAITGLGFTSGLRVVVGQWESSPFGTFADAMVQRPGGSGERILIAPTEEIADFIATTYTFDRVLIEPVTSALAAGHGWLRSPTLEVTYRLGGRPALGRLLRLLPQAVATRPEFAAAVDPVARRIVPGVRTAGVARPGRREYYGAYDQHLVRSAEATWEGHSVGRLAPVSPPCTFGFSSVPPRPVRTSLVTTVTTVG